MKTLHIFISALYFYLTLLQTTSASLFGLDIGGKYSKACYLSSQGKNLFQIVENSSGKRKTPTGVGYYQNKRSFEREISNRKNRDPDLVFQFPTRFLGKSQDSAELMTQ